MYATFFKIRRLTSMKRRCEIKNVSYYWTVTDLNQEFYRRRCVVLSAAYCPREGNYHKV